MANGYGEGIPTNTCLETLRVPKQCIRKPTICSSAQLISPFVFTTQYNFCTSYLRNFNLLAYYGCTGRFVLDLVGNPIVVFSSPARSAQSYCCHLGRTRLRLRLRLRVRPRHTFG